MSGVIIDVDVKKEKSQRDLEQINASLQSIKKSTESATTSFANMAKGIAATVASGLSVAYLVRVSNEFKNLSNQVALVTGHTKELTYAQSKLLDISKKTYTSVESSAKVFSTFGKTLKDSGVATEALLTATEAVNKAILISGSSTESARAAVIQLGQGIASGALRGEELNSVMEQTPRIAKAIADELNVGVGQLRKMAEAGNLTSNVVFSALQRQAAKINAEFAIMTPTLERSFTALSVSAKEFTYNLDLGIGFSVRLARVISDLASKMASMAAGAETLGLKIGTPLTIAFNNTKLLLSSIFEVVKALGSELTRALPTAGFTQTFIKDMQGLAYAIDDMFNRAFSSGYSAIGRYFRNFFHFFDSDVEKALSTLGKLLNPVALIREFNQMSLKRFLDTHTLITYVNAFNNLAAAIKTNNSSIIRSFWNFVSDIGYSFQALLRYVGLLKDTTFTFKLPNTDGFLSFITDFARGLTGLSVSWFAFSDMLYDTFGSGSTRLKIMLKDVFKSIPDAVVGAGKVIIEMFVRLSKNIIQIIKDTFQLNNLNPFNWILSAGDALITGLHKSGSHIALLLLSIFTSAIAGIKEMARSISNVFSDIYQAAMKYSWVDKLEDKLRRLPEILRAALSNLKDKIEGTLSDIEIDLSKSALKFGKDNGKVASKINNGIFEGFRERELGFKLSYSGFDKFLFHVDLIFSSIAIIAVSALDIAFQAIARFSRMVIEEFREIYDAVIGHSWWTDTISGVIDSTASLTQKVAPSLNAFMAAVSNTFKKISEFKFEIGGRKNLFESLFPVESVGTIMRATLAVMAGIIGTFVLPSGVFKTLFLTAMVSSAVTSGALLAEKFSDAFTDSSFIVSIGHGVGSFIGAIVASIIRDLPQFINAILGLISGAFAGFTAQLPAIGGIFSGLASIASLLGLAGPLGLIGSILLGTAGLTALTGIKSVRTTVDGIGSFLSGTFKFITGTFDGKGGGLGGSVAGAISQFLFAGIDPFKIVAGIGLIAKELGAFDALFKGSELASYAATGGLLTVLIMGKGGYELIERKSTAILGDIFKALRGYVKTAAASGGSAGSFIDNFLYGNVATNSKWSTHVKNLISATVEDARKYVIKAAAPYAKKGAAFITHLLFGADPDQSIQFMKNRVFYFFQDLLGRVGLFKDEAIIFGKQVWGHMFPPNNTVSNLWNAFLLRGTATVSAMQTRITAMFATTNALAASSAAQPIGLLQRIFFGKYAVAAWLGLILLTFSSFTLASEKAVSDTESFTDKLKGSVEALKESFTGWVKENPFEALAKGAMYLTGTLIALWGATKLVQGVLATMKTRAAAAALNTASTLVIPAVGRRFSKGGAVAGAAIGGIGGALVGSTPTEIMTDVAIGALIGGFLNKLTRGLAGKAGAAILGALSAAWGFATATLLSTVASGLVLVGGLAALWFFGEGTTLADKINYYAKKIKMMLPFGEGKRMSEMEESIASSSKKFLTSKGIDAPNFKELDLKDIAEPQYENLKETATEYNGAVKAAMKEQYRTGQVSEETMANLRDLSNAMRRQTDAAQNTKRFDFENIPGLVEKARETDNAQFLDKTKLNVEQAGLDAKYKSLLFLKQQTLRFAPSNQRFLAETELNRHIASKDTKYNALSTEAPDKLARAYALLNSTPNVGKIQDKELLGALEKATIRLKNHLEDKPLLRKAHDFIKEGEEAEAAWLDLVARVSQVALDEHNVQMFSKRLNDLTAGLKLAGVELGEGSLLGGSRESIIVLEDMGEEFKRLEKKIKDMSQNGIKDWNEYNDLIRDKANLKAIAEVKLRNIALDANAPQLTLDVGLERLNLKMEPGTEVNFSEEEAKKINNSKKKLDILDTIIKSKNTINSAAQLRKFMDDSAGLGEGGFSAIFGKEFSDKVIAEAKKGATGLTTAMDMIREALRTGAIKTQAEIDATSGKGMLRNLAEASGLSIDFTGMSSKAITNMLAIQAKIKAAKEKAETDSKPFKVLEVISPGRYEQIRKPVDKIPGTSTDNTDGLTDQGLTWIPPVTREVTYLPKVAKDAQAAAEGLAKLGEMTKEGQFALERATPEYRSLSTVLSSIGVSLTDAVSFESADFSRLRQIDAAIAGITKSISIGDTGGMADVEVKKLSDRQYALELEKRRLLEKNRVMSMNEMLADMQAMGSTRSPMELLALGPKVVSEYTRLSVELLKIKGILGDKRAPKGTRDKALIDQEDVNRQLGVLNLKDRSFSSTERLFNGIQPTGLNLDNVSGISKDVLDTALRLSAEYDDIQRQIKEQGPLISAKNLDESVDRISQLSEKLRAVKFSFDLAKIARESYSERIERLAKVFPELNISAQAFDDMTKGMQDNLSTTAFEIAILNNALAGLGTSAEDRAAAIVYRKTIRDKQDAAAEVGTPSQVIGNQLKITTARFSDIDTPSSNLNDAAVGLISSMRKDLEDAMANYSNVKSQLTPSETAAALAILREKKENLDEAFRLATITKKDSSAYKAGQEFASTIRDSFSNGLKGLARGDKTFKETVSDIGFAIASRITDTFIDGMTSALTKKGGVLDGLLEDIGANLFQDAAKIFGGNNEPEFVFSNAVDKFGAWVSALSGSQVSGNLSYFTEAGEDLGGGHKYDPIEYDSYDFVKDGPGALKNEEFAKLQKTLTDPNIPFADALGNQLRNIGTTFMDGNKSIGEKIMSVVNAIMTLGLRMFGGSLGGSPGGGNGLMGGLTNMLSKADLTGTGTFLTDNFGIGGFSTDEFANLGSSFIDTGATESVASVMSEMDWSSIFSFWNKGGMVKAFASGGPVYGAGTATSDSIPAMLSDGEFIINAKSAAKYKNLLHGINSGQLSKFAEGGVVGTSLQPDFNSMASANTRLSGGQNQVQQSSTFNITITGDISKQTKSEIYKMLPNIAAGVNMHNKERGLR